MRGNSRGELPHILVVDDEDLARESLGAILEESYRVTLARSGEEALGILRAQTVHVVCTDYQMPGMDGRQLLNELATVSPATVGVLVTGFPELAAKGDRERNRGHLIVVKPFTPQRLLEIVAQAMIFNEIRSTKVNLDDSSSRRTGR